VVSAISALLPRKSKATGAPGNGQSIGSAAAAAGSAAAGIGGGRPNFAACAGPAKHGSDSGRELVCGQTAGVASVLAVGTRHGRLLQAYRINMRLGVRDRHRQPALIQFGKLESWNL
jgi:hypothetical protein